MVALWHRLGADHDAGSEPGLDRLAFLGQPDKLDIVGVCPARSFDRQDEPLHPADDGRGVNGLPTLPVRMACLDSIVSLCPEGGWGAAR